MNVNKFVGIIISSFLLYSVIIYPPTVLLQSTALKNHEISPSSKYMESLLYYNIVDGDLILSYGANITNVILEVKGNLIIDSSESVTISNSQIHLSGALYIYSNDVILTGNTFNTDSTFSIIVVNTELITISNNIISNPISGINIINSSQVSVLFNEFQVNNIGIMFDGICENNMFISNNILTADYSFLSITNHNLYNNIFVNNSFAGEVINLPYYVNLSQDSFNNFPNNENLTLLPNDYVSNIFVKFDAGSYEELLSPWNVNIPMSGNHIMAVKTVDINNNYIEEFYNITIATEMDPPLIMNRPGYPFYIVNSSVYLIWTLEEINPSYFYYLLNNNYHSSNWEDTTIVLDFNSLNSGNYSISIYFFDTSGNYFQDHYSFYILNSNDDSDGDGLSNSLEIELKISPYNRDSDGDMMSDSFEYHNNLDLYSDDSQNDLDNDLLVNLDEYKSNSDPNNPDTDGDSMNDGWEVSYGLNPTNEEDGIIDTDLDKLLM